MKAAKAFLICSVFLFSSLLISAQEVTIATREAGKELLLPGILHKPNGDGPFSAVVMLCGCDGYANPKGGSMKQQAAWAERLVSWGYVALQLDSFTPRGYPDGICASTGGSEIRSSDAFSAKAYLSTLSFIDAKNIAVIGWSHGGWGIMRIVDGFSRDKKTEAFKAAVAFYPPGETIDEPDTPLLILIGQKDDWCPVYRIGKTKKSYANSKYEFALTIYSNAYHAFDIDEPAGDYYGGHHLEYDPEASADAISRTRDFLAKYIGTER